MRKNRRFIKITAAVLPVILTAGAVCTPLQAKAPKVEIDESMYVNMDYYGEIDDISVVKGCFLNGNTVIEDYGNYEEIINMSDRTEPVVEDGKVTWNLDNVEKQYFYYECKQAEADSDQKDHNGIKNAGARCQCGSGCQEFGQLIESYPGFPALSAPEVGHHHHKTGERSRCGSSARAGK